VKKTEFGMIGMGVMSSNLARNMVSKGFAVSCCDWSEPLRKNFAAHIYERIDKPRGEFFHTQWFN
jgi:6-phosphogluconate dehydrogenase